MSKLNDENQTVETWPEVIPLPPLFEVPSYNNELAPEPWMGWIQDHSRRIGCPPEMLLLNALSAFAIICGRLFAVQPKQLDTGWKAYLSQLWCMIIASSGSKKSPAMSAAFEPLYEFERDVHRQHLADKKKNQPEIDLLGKQLRELKSQLTQDSDKEAHTKDESEILEKLRELNRPELRLLTQEATIQAICIILQVNHLGIGITLDELTSFFTGLDRDNRQTDRAFYLMGWNGNQVYAGDTVSRGNTRVEYLAVSITGSIQPKIFQKYCHDLIKKKGHGDGLLARFQLVTMPKNEKCVGVDVPPNLTEKARYTRSFIEVGKLRIVKDKEGSRHVPSIFQFDSDAQEVFNIFINELEAEIEQSEDQELYHDFLAKQRSTMPLLAMLYHVIAICANGTSRGVEIRLQTDTKITRASAMQAVRLSLWMRETAKAVYCTNTNLEGQRIKNLVIS